MFLPAHSSLRASLRMGQHTRRLVLSKSPAQPSQRRRMRARLRQGTRATSSRGQRARLRGWQRQTLSLRARFLPPNTLERLCEKQHDDKLTVSTKAWSRLTSASDLLTSFCVAQGNAMSYLAPSCVHGRALSPKNLPAGHHDPCVRGRPCSLVHEHVAVRVYQAPTWSKVRESHASLSLHLRG